MIIIKLKKSPIGRSPAQKEALRCLGLRKTNQVRKVSDHKTTWGQIQKIKHLLEVTIENKSQL